VPFSSQKHTRKCPCLLGEFPIAKEFTFEKEFTTEGMSEEDDAG
jgi:hypothetical protein